MKKCSSCNKTKSEEDFYKRSNGTVQAQCKECVCKSAREYRKENKEKISKNKKRYQKENYYLKIREKKTARRLKLKDQKLKIVNQLKSKGCTDCGKKYSEVAMDLDHVGKKRKDISSIIQQDRGIQFLMDELKECEVVCSNCHRIRSKNRKSKTKFSVRQCWWIVQELKSFPCERCKNMYDSVCMDFDHIDIKTKKFRITKYKDRSIMKSLKPLLNEIKKCRLLCSNCHRIETKKQRDAGLF